jgi:hypothetical protein
LQIFFQVQGVFVKYLADIFFTWMVAYYHTHIKVAPIPRDFDWTPGTELPVSIYTFDPQLKFFLTFSVNDRYQLNYFISIKDFNAETNTSLKLNLFSFFICGCQHHQRKTICLYAYISVIRQIVGYRTPVFIQRFPWRLHITITYNLPHLRLWYADVVTLIA